MLITLSHQNPKPLYEQIVDEIRRKILAGELQGGEALPSIRQLAAELTTSVITTKRAYQELEREGLIYTRAGMGSFVSDTINADRDQLARQELRKLLLGVCRQARASGLTAAQLQSLLQEIIAGEEIW